MLQHFYKNSVKLAAMHVKSHYYRIIVENTLFWFDTESDIWNHRLALPLSPRVAQNVYSCTAER